MITTQTQTLRLVWRLLPLLVLFATALRADDTLLADQLGVPNPDQEHIHGATGAERIAIAPRGDAGDHGNLQWAIDNVAAGGTVALGAGTFFLGDGEQSPKQTVVVRRGVRILGQREGEVWQSVVRGGGVLGCGPRGIESGAFLIRNQDDPHPVVFEGLWLREWTAEAVCIEASRGFAFRRCRLSDPVNTEVEGAVRFVHALWTTGPRARGDFLAEDNMVELGHYQGPRADDEQFMGVFFSNHDNIRITGNTIVGIDEAIELIGNRFEEGGRDQSAALPPRGPSEIVVSRNKIEVTQQPGERWPSTVAILVAGNREVEAVRIEDNELVVRGRGFAFGLSGDRLHVAGNRVRLGAYDGKVPAGAVTIGYGQLSGRPMGSALNDSVFEDNTFEGAVREFGIVFRETRDATNDSHGNRFDLGDSLARLGAKTTLALSKAVHENVFLGDLGTVEDRSPPGANRLGDSTGTQHR